VAGGHLYSYNILYYLCSLGVGLEIYRVRVPAGRVKKETNKQTKSEYIRCQED
jgi:hypothetical protein